MATSEWRELLGRSGIRDISQSDLVREIGASTSGGITGATGFGGVTGGSTGSGQRLQQQGSSTEMTEQISALVSQISGLNATEQTAITALQGNTQAVTQNTSSKGSGTSVASQAGGIAESLLGGALSLSPIVSGIMSLFGGSSSPAPAMTPFLLPAPVQYQAGVSRSSGASPVSYGEGGQPRAQSSAPAPQVTVQVSAMDSQSFLDHSDDIANAVRAALLNSNPLSDVIADL